MKEAATIEITNAEMQYPSLLRRVQALFIDFLLILLTFATSSVVIGMIGDTATGVKVSVFVFCVIIYEPMLVSLMGGTLGQKALGMQVKRYEAPDRNISIFSAIIRVIMKGLLGWISFLTISFNSEKRAIHDMISGSVVMMK